MKEKKPYFKIYHCPINCEGNKSYTKLGRCPKCELPLIEQTEKSCCKTSKTKKVKKDKGIYYCPMYCQGDKVYTKTGSCPICGMELINKLIDPSRNTIDNGYKTLKLKFWVSFICTLPILILEMTPAFGIKDKISSHTINLIYFLFSIPVVFYCGGFLFKRAWKSFITIKLNMFTLIGIGVGVAYLYSIVAWLYPSLFPYSFRSASFEVFVYFETVTVIISLVILGQLLEARTHKLAKSALNSLIELAPLIAIRIKNDKQEKIPVKDIKVGDVLIVKAGDKIPVDGIITKGNAVIDTSMLTGEPLPKELSENDFVNAGTINTTGYFLFKATKVGSDTLLSQIIQCVEDSKRTKIPIQKLVDKVVRYFVPSVIVIAILTFVFWFILGPEPSYIYGLINALSVLIIACPCALGLATPISITVGLGRLANEGILIKNAEAIEKMQFIDTLIIDKTGTLTQGTPVVKDIISFGALTNEEVLKWAASVNQGSSHPFAKALSDKARERTLDILSGSSFKTKIGAGVFGEILNKKVGLYSEKELKLKVKKADFFIDKYKEYCKTNKIALSASFLVIDQQCQGMLIFSDLIKKEAKQSIDILKKENVKVVMLTGDNEQVAKSVANTLGIDTYFSRCLPEDKMKIVKKWQLQGANVLMAGDGINDVPALTQANLSIALGTGTAIAMENAEIIIVKGDLKGIIKAKKLSQIVFKNIKQNLFFAFVYNILGIPLASGVLYPVFGLLLSPVFAATAMSLSSISVISNALRLRIQKNTYEKINQ